MIFDRIEDEQYKDKPISFVDRLVIKAMANVAKLVINKLKKAKTYGEFNQIGKSVGVKIEALESRFDGAEFEKLDDDAQMEKLAESIQSIDI